MKSQFLRWAVLPLITVLIIGCIPSLNPVYTEADLVFDPAIVGTWAQGEKTKWEFSKLGEKKYRLVYTGRDGKQGVFVARLAQLDGARFLDLYPEKLDADQSGFYNFHLVPIHTVYLVRGTEPGLQLASIDYEWLKKHLDANSDTIQFATFQNKRLITAPTNELQEFVVEHKDKFTGNFELTRVPEDVN